VSAIDPQVWQRIDRHLDRALDLPPDAREVWLAALRDEDSASAADVEAMLESHRLLSAEGFLDGVAHAIEPTLAGAAIGAYRLLSPIGHGGMGSVWLAVRSDSRYEGRAAVKLLNTARVGRAGEERFRREATILARLTHPHIVRLVDAGVTGAGQPYLVLEHVEGRHIDRFCDDERLGIEDRVRLFLDLQAAVAHAHANRIVHCDLKPSNVLVTASGQVKLLDFGIATLLGVDDDGESASTLTTEEGDALTPKYAAPEQVTRGRITTATDVYSLGVLLFELLSGRHPTGVDARSPAEFIKSVADTEPARLSAIVHDMVGPHLAATLAANRATTTDRLRRILRGDLQTVVGKALKKDPAERYESVAEFADDLRRFLDRRPINARPDWLGYHAATFVQRHWPLLSPGQF
jgi:serine/threonine-protein kinase